MKLLHVYPAVAAICDSPRLTPGTVVVQGRTFYMWRGYNVYLDTTERVTRYKVDPNGRTSYWCEIKPDLLACIVMAQDDAHLERILTTPQEFGQHAGKRPIDELDAMLAANLVIAADPEAYTVRETAAKAARTAERNAERLRKDTEHRERVEQETKDRIAGNTAALLKGDCIALDGFLELCKMHHVTVPIQTIGSARKNVRMVSTTSITCYGAGRPWKLITSARELKTRLTQEVT